MNMRMSVCASLVMLFAGIGQAAEIELDDFQSYDVGLDFVTATNTIWSTTPGFDGGAFIVSNDSSYAEGNQVMVPAGRLPSAWMNIPPVSTNDNDTTLAFRLMFPEIGVMNLTIGLSDELDPGDPAADGWNAFGPIIRASEGGMFGYRDGNGYTDIFAFESNTWYDVTLALKQTTETYDVYVEGGVYTTNTLVASDAAYRQQGDNGALQSFLIKIGNVVMDPVFIDYGIFAPLPTLPVTISTAYTAGSGLELSWSNQVEMSYSVETNSSLMNADWNAMTPDVSSTGATATIIVPTSAEKTFYRVITIP